MYPIVGLIQNSPLRQVDIAERAGVTQQNVSRWVCNAKQPGWDKVAILAEILGCTPRDIRPDIAAAFDHPCPVCQGRSAAAE